MMDVGVNKPFKGYVRQAYENFMIGNIENRKDRREDIVQWIEIGWEKVKVETITRTWTKVGIEIVTIAVQNDFAHVNLLVFLLNCSYDL